MKKVVVIPAIIVGLFFSGVVLAQRFQINDLEYFETRGANVLVFNNQYIGFFYDEKTAGIEIIHHGVRTATNGAVRLTHTPEQWDLIPTIIGRKVNRQNNSIEVTLRYDQYDFNSRIVVQSLDDGILLTTYIDKPIPKALEGYAGFNLEFLPSAYFEKTYLIDNQPGIFPLYPSCLMEVRSVKEKISQFFGHTTFDDRGRGEFVLPKPFAAGKEFILAPEDPERRVSITAIEGTLLVFDGRAVAQNGWYVVRSLIPSKKKGKVIEWKIKISTIENWIRKPNIGYSQVGYHPSQLKRAIIELDKYDTPLKNFTVYQVTSEGEYKEKFICPVQEWGNYLRYNYVIADFSSIREPGLYVLQYGNEKTSPFPIVPTVYNNTWQQTLGVWFPVQMDHMYVNEAYRVWHGIPYKDDALQAPPNHKHFDGYEMGPTTDTKYKPLERIPGLAVGGWFDAGDFDIQTGSHCAAVLRFVNTWEQFQLNYDETYIDQKQKYVDIRRPDGIPDLLQQIEHGTLQLVAQQKAIGHAVRGIIVPNLHQYHHLGDATTVTDNLPYNPNLKPYETDGVSSGTLDDRWVFTNREPWLNYYSAAALAAAHRVLKQYNKQLSEEALEMAKQAWKKEEEDPIIRRSVDEEWFFTNTKVYAALELFITTGDSVYLNSFDKHVWSALNSRMMWNMEIAARALNYLGESYKEQLRPYVLMYRDSLEHLQKRNPYGVPIETRGWGANSIIIMWGITNYYLHKAFPDIIDKEYVYKALNYIYGCHPYSNISFVSGVGVNSKKVAYGGNRADFTFIAGGVVPGLLILQPDYPENKEDWPFFWGENEYVVDICASYIFLTQAVNDLVSKE